MRALALVVIIVFGGACGPIAYVNDVTRKASDAVAEARAAEADKYSPYHWTRAVEYLRQARTIAAHADYQAANRFGRLAAEAAELAVQESNAAKKDPSKVKGKKPDDDAPPLDKKIAPAKDAP